MPKTRREKVENQWNAVAANDVYPQMSVRCLRERIGRFFTEISPNKFASSKIFQNPYGWHPNAVYTMGLHDHLKRGPTYQPDHTTTNVPVLPLMPGPERMVCELGADSQFDVEA